MISIPIKIRLLQAEIKEAEKILSTQTNPALERRLKMLKLSLKKLLLHTKPEEQVVFK